jgi:hypothetical protein
MKYWLSIAVVICCYCIPAYTASGQQLYTVHQILHAADSCLRSYVGDSLFAHFKHERLMDYLIADSLAGSWHGYLTDTSNAIYGKLIYVSVDYYYYFVYPKCPQLPPFTGRGHISLDSNLHQTNRLWFAFLPERIVKNLSCDFISEAEAITIAEKAGIESGPAPIQAVLRYYAEVKDYVWMVSRNLTEVRGDFVSDMVYINAASGMVVLHEKYIPPPPFYEDHGHN